jgi:hypothetical protein
MHCVFIRYENIVEVGFLSKYTENKVDIIGTDNFFYDFFAISFTIKNLPTPFFVKDSYPLIKMTAYNGTGFGYGNMLSYTNFTVAKVTPNIVSDLGVVFKQDLVPDISSEPILVLDTYFAPYQVLWNGSYFVVEYPQEITLPGLYDFTGYTDKEIARNRT